MKTILITLSILFFTHSIYAQKIPSSIPETREVVLNSADTIRKIRIFVINPKVKIKGEKFYAWYQKQLVLHTQGAWSGKLLQGKYEVFHPNHNLLEQGLYEKGWKVDAWKKWYPDGTLQEHSNWKKGLLHGITNYYNTTGQLTEKRNYRKGKLHGKLIKFSEGKSTEERYRNNKLVVKKKKNVKKEKKKSTKPVSAKKSQKKNSLKKKKKTPKKKPKKATKAKEKIDN